MNKYKNISSQGDEELVSLILNTGDTRYFEIIYDRYALKVYQKCLSFTKNDSEAKDVAHDVMVKLYLNLNKFSATSKFSTWLYAITYNHCVDHESKKKKQNTLKEDILEEYKNAHLINNDEVPDSVLMDIHVETLDKLLNQLSISDKSVLLMKYMDGLSIKEIAVITEAGESAVKMKLKRSKEKLVKLYERTGKQ